MGSEKGAARTGEFTEVESEIELDPAIEPLALELNDLSI